MSKRVFAGVRLLLTFTFLLALADAAPARAATYYVAANGRDSNTGASLSSPFQTVMRAAAVAGPGDTVLIRAGVYREEVDLSRSRGGAPGRPLTFKSYNGEAVAIEGSDPVTGWTPDSGGVWKKNRLDCQHPAALCRRQAAAADRGAVSFPNRADEHQ